MKKLWILTVLLGTACGTWADTIPAPTKVHRPYFLRDKDKIPNQELISPALPLLGFDGQTLDAPGNIKAPSIDVMDQFSDPPFFEELRREKLSETKTQFFYWHLKNFLSYCHFRDLEGNNWYGWTDEDGNFNWVLWKGHRYWWHDPFAGHWLYYCQGCWWRSDGQSHGMIQAYLDGEYYVCDANGNILEDRGQDGTGAIVSAPGIYQGDQEQASPVVEAKPVNTNRGHPSQTAHQSHHQAPGQNTFFALQK
jgi:hypothetical protein